MSRARDTLRKIKKADRLAQAIAEKKVTLEEHLDHLRIKKLIRQGLLPRYIFKNKQEIRGNSYFGLTAEGKADFTLVSTFLTLTKK